MVQPYKKDNYGQYDYMLFVPAVKIMPRVDNGI